MSNYLQKTLSLDSESKLDFDTAREIPRPDFLHPHSNFCKETISSCRGFIFLHNSSNFNIWNPSTGVHKQIPLSPNELKVYNYCYLYGFGYDQLRDDYLVVSVSFDISLDDNYSRLEFFSLRDNTWKEIEGTQFPYINYHLEPRVGSVFNGAIYWLASHENLLIDVILAFDLTKRELLEMPFPDGFNPDFEDCDFWVFGESLSLWAMDYDNDNFEIWVMKEYKVHSSWTKTLVFSIDDISTRYFYPICSTKSGDIVGKDVDTVLQKYNNKGQLLEHESYCEGPLKSQVVIYTESLFSLPGDNIQV
jgi:F-box interacting protein